MYIQKSVIDQTGETAHVFKDLLHLNHNSIDFSKLLGFSWISYVVDHDSPASTFIFREEKQELLVVKDGIVKKGSWEMLVLSNSILINDGENELLFNIMFFGHTAVVLKKENLDEFLILIKRSKDNLQEQSLPQVIHALMDDYNRVQKQFDNINLDSTDPSLEFEDIAEFHEYRLFPYVATLGSIVLILTIIIVLVRHFWWTS